MKKKKEINKLEKLSLDELLERLDIAQKDISTQIVLIQTKRGICVDELNKFEQRQVPIFKILEKVIKEQEPLYSKYHEMGMELLSIKQEIIRRTGLKEADIKLLYDQWRIGKVLNHSSDRVAF